jgi:hypothetical protein
MDIEGAFDIKHPHVPARLYKYREFSEAHLDALKRGVLFVSSVDKFNDPYELSFTWGEHIFKVEDTPLERALQEVEALQNGSDARNRSFRGTPQKTHCCS